MANGALHVWISRDQCMPHPGSVSGDLAKGVSFTGRKSEQLKGYEKKDGKSGSFVQEICLELHSKTAFS